MSVTFDWSVNIGNVITLTVLLLSLMGGALKGYHVIDKRIEKFETKLMFHAATLSEHTARFLTNEERLIELAGDMQRVIGRLEMMREWNGSERRHNT